MNKATTTSALLLISAALLATGCSSQNVTPDQIQATTASEVYDNSYDSNAMASVPAELDPITYTEPSPTADSLDSVDASMAIDSGVASELPDAPVNADEESDLPPHLLASDSDLSTEAADSHPEQIRFQFGFDKKELSPAEVILIQQHGQYLATHPEQKISINGHSDAQGDSIYNQYLAQQRAQYVARLLADEGVNADQLEVLSWGSDRPLAAATSNRDNRRVELIYQDDMLVNYQSN